MDSTAAERLGIYVAGIEPASLPADITEKAKLCILDSVGCMLGAEASTVAPIMAGFASDSRCDGGTAFHLDCGIAAFTYATLINALDFDDIHKKGHPGATIMAATLALGETLGSTGKDLIAAVVAGYEVSGRLSVSLVQTQPRKTIHGHGTWQTLGAAAAAAKLLQLDARRAAHALAIAAANAPVASVMKTVYGATPTMAKNNFGTAAQVGVTAALLAHRGFEGPLDIFDGETGFWRMFGADRGDSELLTKNLGEVYEIRDVGFKPFSCCRILQSSIEATLAVFGKADIDPRADKFRIIHVAGPTILCKPPFSDPRPQSMWAAQFSAPYTIAVALLGIETGPAWYSALQLSDPETMALAQKIELRPYQDVHDAAGGRSHHHAARVDLVLDDGQAFRAEIKIAKGEAANPVSAAFLQQKFLRLAGVRMDAQAAAQLQATIESLENYDAATLLRQIRAPRS